MSTNPIPISTPSFWDTLKLMFFIGDGNPSPQKQGKLLSPGEDQKKELQQRIKSLDSSRWTRNAF